MGGSVLGSSKEMEMGQTHERVEASPSSRSSALPPAEAFDAEAPPPRWFKPWILLLGCCYIYFLIFMDRGACGAHKQWRGFLCGERAS